ncbi:sulfate transporter [Diplodia corticola]|uniref:Sulfate transporter n=1 Tax=Diplodia corticola TaxID=236234 RepID=A0A1J9SCY7_9PEZI|nr:sulfate transporter [Diplodia corticola]OJD37716.1 sulfate transporter [Diplodia corticola]
MSRRQGKMPGDPAPSTPRLHLPFTSQYVDDADLSYQPGESSTANTRPQPISSPPRPTTSSGDTPEYSSQGVRDKTQELSMHALSESGSFRSPSVLAHRLSGAGSPRGRRPAELANDTFDQEGARRDSLELPSPGIIEEESEPSSPEPLQEAFRPRPVSSAGPRPRSAATANGDPHRDPRRSTDDRRGLSETSSLLANKRPQSRKHYGSTANTAAADVEGQRHGPKSRPARFWNRVSGAAHSAVNGFHRVTNPKSWDREAIFQTAVVEPVHAVPAVFLGLLLNVLDGLSYGIILFPLGEPIFASLGVDGLSMFFVSCIVAQLVYSLGGSTFKGAVGSEMIEVVPFFHKMTYVIMARMGPAEPKAIIATVVVSYAISSIITGLIFGALGLFKLGNLVSFFPRNILNGCIGGVGFFLFVTGIEVSARIDGNLEYNLVTLHKLFRADTIALWTSPLALAIIYMVIKHYYDHPALMPAFIVLITGVFHIIVAAVSHFNLDKARDAGWVFAKPESGVPFYHFYTLYDFSVVDWSAIFRTIPTMFALSFFGIIHVPINVPALALSAKEDDVDINRELVAHGLSNGLSGLVGSIQNYLVYVNSVMFMDHGGNSRMAGLMLAAATTGVWMAGPGMIGYVPIMVVGTLIFYLGIDLLKEALWDTLGRLTLLEYLTIVTIVLIMGIYDFVWGVLAGIVLACLTYVVQTSRTPVIRSTYNGAIAQSTVRRPPMHQKYLREVGQQVYVAKIAGYLFFGTIVSVENDIRKLVDEEQFRTRPIRYVVLDMVHVIGIDYSAAEVLVRLNRILHRRNVTLVISSISLNDEVGQGLSMVGLFAPAESNDEHCPPPQRFETLNKALEWCENELLGTLHERARSLGGSPKEAGPLSITPPKLNGIEANPFDGAFNSPRRAFLHEAANLALKDHKNATVDEHSNVLTPDKWKNFAQPIPLMLLTFQDLSDRDIDFWHRATPYFQRCEFTAGTVLYSRGDDPNGFYLVEKGSLRADYDLEQGHYYESIQAGTTCGELPFFSETDRTGTVAAETETVAWLLTREKWKELERKQPEVASELLRICLKLTSERMNAITS